MTDLLDRLKARVGAGEDPFSDALPEQDVGFGQETDAPQENEFMLRLKERVKSLDTSLSGLPQQDALEGDPWDSQEAPTGGLPVVDDVPWYAKATDVAMAGERPPSHLPDYGKGWFGFEKENAASFTDRYAQDPAFREAVGKDVDSYFDPDQFIDKGFLSRFGKTMSSGTKSSGRTVEAYFYSTLAQVQDLLGDKEDAQFWRNKYEVSMMEKAKNRREIEKTSDIKTFADSILYGAGAVAEGSLTTIPSVVVSTILNVATKGRGGKLAPWVAGYLGALAPSAVMEVGATGAETYEKVGRYAHGKDFLFGFTAASLDAIGSGRIGGRLGGGAVKEILDVARKRGIKPVSKRISTEMTKQFFAEGVPESMQEVIEKIPSRLEADEPLWQEGDGEMMKEAFIQGGLTGMVFGGGTQAYKEFTPGSARDKTQKILEQGVAKWLDSQIQTGQEKIMRPGEEVEGPKLGEIAPELETIRKELGAKEEDPFALMDRLKEEGTLERGGAEAKEDIAASMIKAFEEDKIPHMAFATLPKDLQDTIVTQVMSRPAKEEAPPAQKTPSEGQKGPKEPTSTTEAYQEPTEGGEPSPPSEGGIELPEIVELAKRINEGKVPGVREFMRGLGQLRTKGEAKDISLREDIFIGDKLLDMSVSKEKADATFTEFKQLVLEETGLSEEEIHFRQKYNKKTGKVDLGAWKINPDVAPNVLSHEIGHVVDKLPENEKRGNILGRIASLKKFTGKFLAEKPGAPGELTEADRQRLKAESKRLALEAKTAAQKAQAPVEGTTEEGITPEDVTRIWTDNQARAKNKPLFDYIAGMSRDEKKSIMKAAMAGDLPQSIKDKFRKNKAAGAPIDFNLSAEEKRIFNDLMDAEIAKRNLFSKEQITKELKALTKAWRPFDETASSKYTSYRYQSNELYADAVSVLVNNPKMIQEMAPEFHKAFMNYMETKPEFKEVWDEIQTRFHDPKAVMEKRVAGREEMFRKGEEAQKAKYESQRRKQEGFVDYIARKVIDSRHHGLQPLRKRKKEGGAVAEEAKSVQYQLEELNYLATEVQEYLRTLNDNVTAPMDTVGATANDLGHYLLLKRISGDRKYLGNPQGLTPKTAKDELAFIEDKWGAEKFAAVEKAAKEYRRLREEFIFPALEESGWVTPELMEIIKEEQDYTKFSVVKYIDDKYGEGTGGRIFRQIGTLEDIENPYVATVLHDMSLIRASRVNKAKLDHIDILKKDDLVEDANLRYSKDVGGQVPKPPTDRLQGLVTVMRNGKAEHYYLPKYIAEMWKYNPTEASTFSQIWGPMNSAVRQVIVSKNPLWMAFNITRDYRQSVKNLPEIRLRDMKKLAGYYRRSWKEVWAEAQRGERSDVIKDMARAKMLASGRVYSSREYTYESELERQHEEFAVNSKEAAAARAAQPAVKKFLGWLENVGRATEIWGKVAGYKYLKDYSSRSVADIGHVVRTRIGTPDYMRKGELQNFTNNIFLFSNVNKEGIRAAWESAKEDPKAYIWKTVMTNMMPKMVLAYASMGGMGEDLRRIVAGIPEYEKRKYTVIPLWLTDEGDSVYVRLPEDYEGQFWGALSYDMFHGKIGGKDGALSLIQEQNPWAVSKLHPYFKLVRAYSDYYLRGLNPIDSWRAKNIVSRKAFEAGQGRLFGKGTKEANIQLGKYAWRSLGGSPFYQPSYSQLVKDQTTIQKILQTPGINILGHYVKISKQGLGDETRTIEADVKRASAMRSIEIEDRIEESVNRGATSKSDVDRLLHQLRREKLIKESESRRVFEKRFFRVASRRHNNPLVNSYLFAQSNEVRNAILDYYSTVMRPAEFKSAIKILRDEKHITEKTQVKIPGEAPKTKKGKPRKKKTKIKWSK